MRDLAQQLKEVLWTEWLIFSSEEDLQVLLEAWNGLINSGYKQDDAAKHISDLIFKELEIMIILKEKQCQ